MRSALTSIAALVCLTVFSAYPVLGQNRGVASAHASSYPAGFNPYAQAGMYNNTLSMYFNTGNNQIGMYNISPALNYNNPYKQPGMYNNSPALYYNNPYNQAGM